MISAVIAQARNRAIGKGNDLPWYLPADLKHFKEVTSGHAVIMGRKTFDSILARLGKPLPNRKNIVVTRDKDFAVEGVVVAHSVQEALQLAKSDEAFVIGGAQIFKQALPYIKRIYLTQIDADVEGDVFLPELPDSEWRTLELEHHQKDEKNTYDYTFITLERTAALDS